MWKLLLCIITIILMVSSSNSVQITCQFNGDTCDVPGTPTIASSTELITITGMPINYVNTAVKNVQMNGPNFAYIPIRICKIFPYLSSMNFKGCSRMNLLKDSLVGCPNILSFQIINGNIPLFPAGFAQSSSKLAWLAFIQTNTARIDRNAFLGLTNLQFLYFVNNQITCLPYDIFQNTPNLKMIDFTGNKITALDLNIFKNLQNLETANFQNNLIATIPSFDFSTTATSPMNMGLKLIFAMNQVRSINPNICNSIKPRMANRNAIRVDIQMAQCQTRVYYIDFTICTQGMSFLQSCFNPWIPQNYVPIKCV